MEAYKPFDNAIRHLIEVDPLAWLRFAGLPGESAELVNADLATVTAEADRVIRVKNPDYLAHVEAQATGDPEMDDRTYFYNASVYRKSKLTVESVVILLRKEADYPRVMGRVAYGKLNFGFHVIRVWETPKEEFLAGPAALLPMATIAAMPKGELPAVISQLKERMGADGSSGLTGELWTATGLLMGLYHHPDQIRDLLKGVRGMRESSFYQDILAEGRAEGRAEGEAKGERRLLLMFGSGRFGEPDTKIRAALDKIDSPERLEDLAIRMSKVESWNELLQL